MTVIGAGIEEVCATPCDLTATVVELACQQLEVADGEKGNITLVVASREYYDFAESLAQLMGLQFREDSALPYLDSWYVENANGRRVGSWAP